MYRRKPFCLSVLLLLCLSQVFAIQVPCTTDADCSNKGVCTTIGSSKFCSCLSGFGGDNCSVRPDDACSFGAVSATSSSLQASSTLNYLYPNLTLTVRANLEESKFSSPESNDTLNVVPYSEELTIIFGNGSYTECDFPNNNVNWLDLAASASDCYDDYSLSLAFTDAKTKCGFADNNGDRVFEQVISINRKYKLETLRGEAITRVDSSVKTLRVIFPLETEVSTSSVQVVGSPSLLAAITLIDYDPSATPEKWIVQTTTSIQSPFKLSLPQVVGSTGLLNSENRFSVGSESVSTVTGCGNNDQDCFQKVALEFVAGSASDACNALDGTVTVRLNVTCSEGVGADCPLLGGETVEVILTLNTADACPVTEQITITTYTLDSYSDAGVQHPRSSFITNQIAYFGAVVEAADADITGRSIKPNSVCFKIGAGACVPVEFNVEASAGGKDPIFSVDFSASANDAVFDALNAADASSITYSVHAIVEVDFSGVSKKSIHQKQVEGSRDVSVSTFVKLEPAFASSGAAVVPSFLALIAFCVFGMFF